MLLSTVFFGSCAGLSIAYHESAHWLLADIDATAARERNQFFVAFIGRDAQGQASERILSYRQFTEHPPQDFEGLALPDGKRVLPVAGDEGSITINSKTSAAGIQTTTVHVVGDTPWASVSVYEVRNGEIQPLFAGNASGWLMLAALLVPLPLVMVLRRPVRGLAQRLFPSPQP